MITVEKEIFGNYKGEDIYKYKLKNENNFQVNILNYGGIITEIIVKNKNSKLKNVVLGYKNFEKYIKNPSYAGMIVGRTSGRIENSQFELNGKVYKLVKNNGENNLHGGEVGLSNRIFEVEIIENGIELKCISPHLEEGYPGTLEIRIKYILTENNELIIEYNCFSDMDTYVNLTNHSYFNLSGNMEKNGDEQILKIEADNICELKEGLIPTGNLLNVNEEKNEIFNLKNGILIKNGIEKGNLEQNEQFNITRAYDHPFVLNWNKIEEKPQIILKSEYSGIKMEIYTTEKIAVVYTGNYLDDVIAFDSIYYEKEEDVENFVDNYKEKNNRYLGVAIETQNYPNGINEKNFPKSILKAGEKYYNKTKYKFL